MARELLTIEALICGYHVYKEIWCADVREELSCTREVENYRDPFAVAVVRSMIDGHAPCQLRVWGLRELTCRLLYRGFNFDGLPINRENWTPQKFPAIR